MGLPDAFLSEPISEIARNSLKMLSRAQTLQNALAGTCERCIATGAPRVYPCIFWGRAWLVYLVGCPQYRWRRDHREFRCRDTLPCGARTPLRRPDALACGGWWGRVGPNHCHFQRHTRGTSSEGVGKAPISSVQPEGYTFQRACSARPKPLKLRREGGFEHAPSRLSYSSISSNQDKPRRSGYLRCMNFSL